MLLWLIIKLISSEIEVSIDIPKMERIGNIECDSKICWSTTRGALKTSFSYYLPDGFDYLTIFFKGVSEANTTFDAYLDDNLGFTVNRFLDLKKWSLPYWNDSIDLTQTKNYDLTIIDLTQTKRHLLKLLLKHLKELQKKRLKRHLQ